MRQLLCQTGLQKLFLLSFCSPCDGLHEDTREYDSSALDSARGLDQRRLPSVLQGPVEETRPALQSAADAAPMAVMAAMDSWRELPQDACTGSVRSGFLPQSSSWAPPG